MEKNRSEKTKRKIRKTMERLNDINKELKNKKDDRNKSQKRKREKKKDEIVGGDGKDEITDKDELRGGKERWKEKPLKYLKNG